MKQDVFNFNVEFLNTEKLEKGLNSSFIALIPKVDNPTSINEFRSISLVNCLYNICSKFLANRLKKVLHGVIY